MKCPHCESETKTRVKETRLADGDVVRRRECDTCGSAFGTREAVDTTSRIGSGRGTAETSQQNIEKYHESKRGGALLQGVWK